MAANPHRPDKASADSMHLGQLTRQQLRDLETKTMSPFQRFMELVIMLLPNICGLVAILEYQLIPNNSANKNPATYLVMLILFIAAYNVYGWIAAFKRHKGDRSVYDKLRHNAPLYSALFLLLAYYDYLTLKTGILTQPFVPCMNSILNIAWAPLPFSP